MANDSKNTPDVKKPGKAGPVEATKKYLNRGQMKVEVTINGELVKVAPGETVELPAGATLPANSGLVCL